MAKIKNENLAQLLMQLRFSPEQKRQKQLDAAQNLLAMVNPQKAYPFEFVCYKITDFHPRDLPEHEPIKGSALIEDLQAFITSLSGKLAGPVTEQKEKVYSIEQLADKFNVSSKTISRWRKKGLVSRKFIFADGKKRLGFLESSVENFADNNPQLISNARNFTQLSDTQKQRIIKLAVSLAQKQDLSRYKTIEKIAAQVNRSHETIRCILLDHEKTAGKIFEGHSGVITSTQAGEIYKLYKQGIKIDQLMERFGRSRSSIYRLINVRRAKGLLLEKVDFITSDEFLEDDAYEQILGNTRGQKRITHEGDDILNLADSSMPKYLRTLKDMPVLNRQREMELFRQYNYLKYLFCLGRAGIKAGRVSGKKIKQLENYLAWSQVIKNTIIEANLRLVVAIARKHLSTAGTLMDLVSEGNMSLMRAVEKFDYTRGFRFATYASWAITKDFARKTPDRARTESMQDIQEDLRYIDVADIVEVEKAHSSLTHIIRDNLDERQQYIILNHFGLTGNPVKKNKKTLKEIGGHLGLSKERVRQIELIALQKLRQSMSIEEFELLIG